MAFRSRALRSGACSPSSNPGRDRSSSGHRHGIEEVLPSASSDTHMEVFLSDIHALVSALGDSRKTPLRGGSSGPLRMIADVQTVGMGVASK